MAASLRIGIVAGEASGDILGAGLIKAIRKQHPDAEFQGVGGPLMIAEGFDSLFPMERLSVMGLVEPLMRLAELLRIRRSLKECFLEQKPDLFLGIDSPDFNLGLELFLREQGVLTAHYVSPSVWAWRRGRIKKIAKSVDRMLTLLPFEAQFYLENNVPVTFVGHPLADQLPMEPDRIAARKRLNLKESSTIVALMPGSRGGEVAMLGEVFIETARWCLHQRNDLEFVIPAANQERMTQLQDMLTKQGKGLPISVIDGQSQTVMTAANAVLMASGTTTLEALLLKRPMVVAYKLGYFTYMIVSRMVKAPFFSLPNLLANSNLVPEVLQNDVRPEMLGPLLLERLQEGPERQQLLESFQKIHQSIRCDASEKAAEVLLKMITSRNNKK